MGSSWSVTPAQRKRAKHEKITKEDEDEEKDDVTVSASEAAMFPIMGSIVLLSLYVCYKLFPKDVFNQVLSVYFLVMATYAVAAFLHPILRMGIPTGLIAIALSGGWWTTQHFAINNAIATALCVTSMWKAKIGSFTTSWILLWGLFIYDIWWVFGTEVMVSVAKNIEAPVLMKVPKSFDAEFIPKNMVMLGLGDIVIPGFFIATCLRFDYWRAGEIADKTKKAATVTYKYFLSAMTFYFLGLVNTIVVMLLFQHAQPALLYLVPWITIGTFLVALLTGELFVFFGYDEEALVSTEKKEAREAEKKEEEAAEANLSYFQVIYNIVIVELFFVTPYTGKKTKTE